MRRAEVRQHHQIVGGHGFGDHAPGLDAQPVDAVVAELARGGHTSDEEQREDDACRPHGPEPR